MIRTLTFDDLNRRAHMPRQMRYIVFREGDIYVACALEWYVVSQGSSRRAAVRSLESLLMSNAIIRYERPRCLPMKPAPEDYQQAWTEDMLHQRFWSVGLSVPILWRGILQMGKTKLTVNFRDPAPPPKQIRFLYQSHHRRPRKATR